MPPQDGPCLIVERLHCCLTQTEPASENGLHSRSGVKDRPSTLLLGASDLTLLLLCQLVASWSAMMVSETSASEAGSLGFLGGRTIMVPPSNKQREDPLALPPLHGNIWR